MKQIRAKQMQILSANELWVEKEFGAHHIRWVISVCRLQFLYITILLDWIPATRIAKKKWSHGIKHIG